MSATATKPTARRRPATGRTRIETTVPPDVARWLDDTAADAGESREVIIRAILRDAIQREAPDSTRAMTRAWWREAGEQIEGGVYHYRPGT